MPIFDIYIVDGRSLRVTKDGRLTEIVNEIEKENENGTTITDLCKDRA